MALTDMEKDALKCVAGLPQETFKAWGAALGACAEYLRENGYLDSNNKLTEKGKSALNIGGGR